MAGVPLHTSAPINSNSENSPSDHERNEISTKVPQGAEMKYGTTNQQDALAGGNIQTTIVEPATKTVPPRPLPQQLNPPPPQPGQVPSLQTGLTNHGYPSASPVRQDLSHPPGYQQQQASFQDRPVVEEQHATLRNSSPVRLGSSLFDSGTGGNGLGDQSPIWDTAKSWAKAAGSKLSTTEAQVWKMMNGEK